MGRGGSHLLKRQLQVAQVALCLDQHQRAFVDHDHRGAFARHMHRAGLGGNGGLHGGKLGGVGVDPLQAGAFGHLLQFVQRQCKCLDLGQAGGNRSHWRCNRRRCWHGRWHRCHGHRSGGRWRRGRCGCHGSFRTACHGDSGHGGGCCCGCHHGGCAGGRCCVLERGEVAWLGGCFSGFCRGGGVAITLWLGTVAGWAVTTFAAVTAITVTRAAGAVFTFGGVSALAWGITGAFTSVAVSSTCAIGMGRGAAVVYRVALGVHTGFGVAWATATTAAPFTAATFGTVTTFTVAGCAVAALGVVFSIQCAFSARQLGGGSYCFSSVLGVHLAAFTRSALGTAVAWFTRFPAFTFGAVGTGLPWFARLAWFTDFAWLVAATAVVAAFCAVTWRAGFTVAALGVGVAGVAAFAALFTVTATTAVAVVTFAGFAWGAGVTFGAWCAGFAVAVATGFAAFTTAVIAVVASTAASVAPLAVALAITATSAAFGFVVLACGCSRGGCHRCGRGCRGGAKQALEPAHEAHGHRCCHGHGGRLGGRRGRAVGGRGCR